MNPWLILGMLVLAIVAGLGGEWHGHATGVVQEKAAWQAREGTELRAANAKILALEEAARKEEAARAAGLDKVAKIYEEKLADAEAQKDRDVRAARAGTLSLRIPTPCKAAGLGGTAQAAPGTGLGDGGATTELPREIAADLFALADDADKVVKQLTACQAVVREDRARAAP